METAWSDPGFYPRRIPLRGDGPPRCQVDSTLVFASHDEAHAHLQALLAELPVEPVAWVHVQPVYARNRCITTGWRLAADEPGPAEEVRHQVAELTAAAGRLGMGLSLAPEGSGQLF